jgi:hypothetical protein
MNPFASGLIAVASRVRQSGAATNCHLAVKIKRKSPSQTGEICTRAAALNKPFVSVDTDRLFLQSVRRKVGALTSAQRLFHGDIGLIGPWGIPFPAGNLSPRRLNKWKAYAQTLWPFLSQDNPPHFVLIDGRFQ